MCGKFTSSFRKKISTKHYKMGVNTQAHFSKSKTFSNLSVDTVVYMNARNGEFVLYSQVTENSLQRRTFTKM